MDYTTTPAPTVYSQFYKPDRPNKPQRTGQAVRYGLATLGGASFLTGTNLWQRSGDIKQLKKDYRRDFDLVNTLIREGRQPEFVELYRNKVIPGLSEQIVQNRKKFTDYLVKQGKAEALNPKYLAKKFAVNTALSALILATMLGIKSVLSKKDSDQ